MFGIKIKKTKLIAQSGKVLPDVRSSAHLYFPPGNCNQNEPQARLSTTLAFSLTLTCLAMNSNFPDSPQNVATVKSVYYSLYLLWRSYTRHSWLKNINEYKNEYKNTQLYKPIQYTHSATYLLTRNAADEHGLISIKIKRICSITNKQEFQS